MKRWLEYAVCVLGLCALFTTCYYFSFKNALSKWNEDAVKRDDRLLESFDEYQKQAKLLLQKNNSVDSAIAADTKEKEVIATDTRYYLETYDVVTNQLTREKLSPTSDMIGMNREQLISYLADYMKDIPLNEKNKGLYAYDLLQFSNREIVLRKSYNKEQVDYLYYVAVKEGTIIVYYSDMTTVYEHTQIAVNSLDEEDREALMHGVYVKTETELYDLLESYSS